MVFTFNIFHPKYLLNNKDINMKQWNWGLIAVGILTGIVWYGIFTIGIIPVICWIIIFAAVIGLWLRLSGRA